MNSTTTNLERLRRMAIEIFNRQELKYVLSFEQSTAVRQAIATHMALDSHNADGTTYRLYNLYFDTVDHALIRHSLSRPTYKEKIRIRSYEPIEMASLVFLEVKKRFKKVTNKRRSKLTYDMAVALIKTGKVSKRYKYMNQQVIDEFEAMFSQAAYEAKTYITYDRLAYFSLDPASDLRVTFDMNITSRRYGTTKEVELLSAGRVIMEAKTCTNLPLWFIAILTDVGVQKQSFSKYGREYVGQLELRNNSEVRYA